MDRLIYTALNSLGNLRGTQLVTAQNLANQNVPGFRRDTLSEGQAFVLEDQGNLEPRAFQIGREQASFSEVAGFMNRTGEDLDIAISDKGWFYVQPDGGGAPALTRRGDLRVGLGGELVNGAGEAVLDQGLRPIVLPPFRKIVVNETGAISIEPIDGAPGERIEVATLATTLATGLRLVKGEDGQIRPVTGPLPRPDQQAKVLQGVLEGSNVNVVEELVDMIECQRAYEINSKMISAVDEMLRNANQTL